MTRYLLVLLATVCSYATTITGVLPNPSGFGGATGTLYLTLSQPGSLATTCGGGPNVTVSELNQFVVTSGVISGSPSVVGNNCIIPNGSYYNVQFVDSSGVTYTNRWTIVGSSFNLTIQVVGQATSILGLPTTNQTISQPFGTNLVVNNMLITGASTLPYVTGAPSGSCTIGSWTGRIDGSGQYMYFCSDGTWHVQAGGGGAPTGSAGGALGGTYPNPTITSISEKLVRGAFPTLTATDYTGADIGAQVNAAASACPTTRCSIMIPPGTFSFSTTILNNSIALLYGSGEGTILNYTGNGTGIQFGTDHVTLRDFNLYLTAAGSSAIGIDAADSSYSGTYNVQVYGSGSGNSQIGMRIRCTGTGTACYFNYLDENTLFRNFGTGILLTGVTGPPLNGPGATNIHATIVNCAIGINDLFDTGGVTVLGGFIEGFTTAIALDRVSNFTVISTRFEDVAGTCFTTTSNTTKVFAFGTFLNCASIGTGLYSSADTIMPTNNASGQYGNTNITGNGQKDFTFFGNSSIGVAQSSAFSSKVHILGGSGQSRSLDLYEVPGGNATIESTVAGNLELKSANTIQADNFLSVASGFQSNLTTVTFSATPTFNMASGNTASITLTGNVTSSTLTNLVAGEYFYFIICQDATGSRTFVWPTQVHGAMTIGATASKCNSQAFISDGTNLYATSAGVINQ